MRLLALVRNSYSLSWLCIPFASLTPRNDTSKPSARLVRLHPLKFRQLMPEPGELPLGVMAGIGAGDRSRLFNANVAPEVPEQRRHAMGLRRRQQRIEPPRRQRRHLLQ